MWERLHGEEWEDRDGLDWGDMDGLSCLFPYCQVVWLPFRKGESVTSGKFSTSFDEGESATGGWKSHLDDCKMVHFINAVIANYIVVIASYVGVFSGKMTAIINHAIINVEVLVCTCTLIIKFHKLFETRKIVQFRSLDSSLPLSLSVPPPTNVSSG